MAEEEKHDTQYKIHSCYICEKTFARSSSMYRHIRNFHKENMKFPTSKSIVCPLCAEENTKETFTNYKKLHLHMKAKHDLKLDIHKHVFQSVEEFHEWKTKVEKETKSQYVKQNGTKKCGNYETLRYYCNRSGFYKPTGHQKRQLKKQGSNKINCCCPSMIKAIINSKSGTTEVEFVVNHVGHMAELDHLFLTKTERQWIAQKLEEGVDISNILDTVRNSQTQSIDQNRLHLLTRKDVLNINKTTMKSKYKVNIDEWLGNVDKLNEKLVLFYKPQEAVAETFPQLDSDDFVLVLMNDYQSDAFRQFAERCVAVDTIQGRYLYGVHMTVVTVMDSDGSAVPVAFMFSSKVDLDVLRVFFVVLQTQVGRISTRVFVSDDDETYLSAWRLEMGEVEHRLLTAWSVDRNWEKNLPKVKAKKLKAYKLLRKLTNETNEQVFLDLLNYTVEQLNADVHCKEFAQFFVTEYANRPKEWANCYRVLYGIGGTKHLETIHKTLKQIYLQGKKVRSLGKTIDVLMIFLRDYYLDKMLMGGADGGRILARLDERHETCVHLGLNEVSPHSDECWTWKSDTGDTCTVTLVKKECLCNLKCVNCNRCIHNFTCTCADSALLWNMCRHIHLLCISIRPGMNEAQPIEYFDVDQTQEMVVQVNTIPVNDPKMDELREKVVKELNQAIENVGQLKTYESLEGFYNESCKPMCEALEGILSETSTITMTDNGLQTLYFLTFP